MNSCSVNDQCESDTFSMSTTNESMSSVKHSKVPDKKRSTDSGSNCTHQSTNLIETIERNPSAERTLEDFIRTEIGIKFCLNDIELQQMECSKHSWHDPHLLLPFLGPGDHYYDACRLTIRIGQAAMKYGSTTERVEIFLANLMEHTFGYPGCIFRVSHIDIICSFQPTVDSLGHSQLVKYESDPSLHKLGLIAELAKNLSTKSISLAQANQLLDDIETEPDVYGRRLQLMAFVCAGGGLAMLYKGSWANIALGGINGAIVYLLMIIFDLFNDRVRQWVVFVSSFVCAVLATSIKALYLPEINVALVSMAGLAVYLPGYSITLGIAELVTNHVLCGMAHLIQGLVTMMYLILGTWVGRTVINEIVDVPTTEGSAPFVQDLWLLLFVPLLFVAITIIFQNSRRDVPWAILCMAVTYGTTLASFTITSRSNIATFLSSIAMVVFSNVWARCADRPNTIILMPALLLKVSGSIGYLGLMQLVDGNSFVGLQQFLSMFVIALLVIVGVFVGNTLVPVNTTL